MPVLFGIMNETESHEVADVIAVYVRRNGQVVAAQNDVFGFLDALLKKRRRNGAFVDVEQRDIAVGDLVQQDDEFDEIGIGLLPEGVVTASVEIVEQRSNVIGQCVGVEVIVQRVVAVLGVETDFDIIGRPSVTIEDVFHLVAKVSFTSRISPPIRLTGSL